MITFKDPVGMSFVRSSHFPDSSRLLNRWANPAQKEFYRDNLLVNCLTLSCWKLEKVRHVVGKRVNILKWPWKTKQSTTFYPQGPLSEAHN